MVVFFEHLLVVEAECGLREDEDEQKTEISFSHGYIDNGTSCILGINIT